MLKIISGMLCVPLFALSIVNIIDIWTTPSVIDPTIPEPISVRPLRSLTDWLWSLILYFVTIVNALIFRHYANIDWEPSQHGTRDIGQGYF